MYKIKSHFNKINNFMLLKLLNHNENQLHYINFLIYFTVNAKSNSK